MDEESLQKSERRRGSCLDVFLVTSIIFLLVTVTAGAAGGVMVVMRLQSKLQPQSPSFLLDTSNTRSRDTPDLGYKMQNFVYVQAVSSELNNSTMQWAPVNFDALTSVGSNFLFDAAQHSLMAKKTGIYFIYIDLNLTCTYKCNGGLLSVSVGDKLTCKVELPEKADSTPVTRKCWTVSELKGNVTEQRLLSQMTVPEKALKYWRLEQSGSGFGMFLVA